MANTRYRSLRCPFLPKSIKSLRLNWSLCTNALLKPDSVEVDAWMTEFQRASELSPPSLKGDIAMYGPNNHAIIQIEQLLSVAPAPCSEDEDRRLFLKTVWDRDILDGLATEELQQHERERLEPLYRCCELLAEKANSSIVGLNGAFPNEKDQINPANISFSHEETVETEKTTLEPWMREISDYRLLQAMAQASPSFSECKDRADGSEMENDLKYRKAEFSRSGIRVQYLRSQIVRMVKQLAHKFPRMSILEIGCDGGTTARQILTSLCGSYGSYILVSDAEQETHTARKLLGAKWKRVQCLTSEAGLPKESTLIHHSFDLVIMSSLMDNANSAMMLSANLHKLLRPDGFLLSTALTGCSQVAKLLRQRLFNAAGQSLGVEEHLVEVEPETQAQDYSFKSMYTIYDAPAESDHAFSATLSRVQDLHQRTVQDLQSLNFLIKHIDPVLIIGGSPQLTSDLAKELRKSLHTGSEEIYTIESIDRMEAPVQPNILYLAELEGRIMEDITERTFSKMKLLFREARNIFWITHNFKQGDPFSAMIVGLGRSIRNESPHLNIGFLDLDSPEDFSAQRLVALFLQFIHGSQVGSGKGQTLSALEAEMSIERNQLLIPRVMYDDVRNDRLNSRFRSITRPPDIQSPSDHLQKAIIMDHSLSTTQGGLEAMGPSIQVKVRFCSKKAVRMKDTYVFLFIGDTLEKPEQSVIGLSNLKAPVIWVQKKWLRPHDIAQDIQKEFLEALVCWQMCMQIQELYSNVLVVLYTDNPRLAQMATLFKDQTELELKILTADPYVASFGAALVHPFASRSTLCSLFPRKATVLFHHTPSSSPTSNRILDAVPLLFAEHNLNHCFQAENASPPQTVFSSLCNISEALSAALEHLGSYTRNLQTFPSNVQTDDSRFVEEYEPAEDVHLTVRKLDSTSLFRSDGTYFLVGMNGELGQSLCSSMADNGVRHIVIASRSCTTKPWHQFVRSKGCQLVLCQLDICDRNALDEVLDTLSKTMPSIIGVVNAAMVLSDSSLDNMSYEDLLRCLGPKVKGSDNLDAAFGNSHDLDFFFMFSSTSALIGNAGQGNYAAANMVRMSIFLISILTRK